MPELEEAEALAAHRLGQVNALEAELRGHLLPERWVEARGRREHAPQLAGGRLLFEEAPERARGTPPARR